MKSSRDSLLRSRLTRRTATVTISAPLASSARAVSWNDLYFPVPTMRRERKERPAMINESDMEILYDLRGQAPRSGCSGDAPPRPLEECLHYTFGFSSTADASLPALSLA